MLGRHLEEINNFFWRTINVEKRLAIIIWRLSTRNSYRSISKEFGIGKSGTIKIFQDGISAILQWAPNSIKFLDTMLATAEAQNQPSKGALRKSCSENMQQICRRTPMPKCDFSKVTLQLYWNQILTRLLFSKFAAYFQNTFS